MGHQRIGRLAKTHRWQPLLVLVGGSGADATEAMGQITNATAKRQSLHEFPSDPGITLAVALKN
jgi:hypothetical protein